MFQKEDCFRLGNIVRLHGYKGEVSIHLDVDNPQEYKGLESVFVEIDGKLIPFFLENIRLNNKGFAVVKFEDYDTEEKSKKILRAELYLPKDLLPELEENEFYDFQIEGYKVIDAKHGEIGIVNRVLDFSGNPIIEIQFKDKEILLPKQEQFIEKVDHENKTLYMNAPDGLIDMYLE